MAFLLKHTCRVNKRLGIRLSTPVVKYLSNGAKLNSSANEQDEFPAPESPHQIYKGMLTFQVRRIKTFTLGTSLMGLSLQPLLYEKMSSSSSISLAVAGASIVGFFTFFTPFLIHYVTKKYVTEIIYDPAKEEYIATVFNFFLTKRQIHFKLADVKVPELPGTFTTLHVKNIPLFCIPPDFIYKEHYGKFMGYDKPINFKLGLENEDPKSKQV